MVCYDLPVRKDNNFVNVQFSPIPLSDIHNDVQYFAALEFSINVHIIFICIDFSIFLQHLEVGAKMSSYIKPHICLNIMFWTGPAGAAS